MKRTITHLNPFDMAILLMLFEGATLFILGYLSSNPPMNFGLAGTQGMIAENLMLGLIVGIAGTIIALAIWHTLRLKLRGKFPEKFTLTHINVAMASVANALFLMLLFNIEDIISGLRNFSYAGIAALGFSATAIALAILFFIYNQLPFKLGVTIGKTQNITKVSPLSIALIAGLYEACILPIMVAMLLLPLPTLVVYPLAGIVSGFVGGIIGTFVLNHISSVLKPHLELHETPTDNH